MSNPTERELKQLAKRAREAWEDANFLDHLPIELAKAGLDASVDIDSMHPDLLTRDRDSVLDTVRRLTSPPTNRKARRAKATRERLAERRASTRLEWLLPTYEAILGSLSEDQRRAYRDKMKRAPHPDGRFASSALDSKELAELRASLYEVEVLFRLVRKWSRRTSALKAAA